MLTAVILGCTATLDLDWELRGGARGIDDVNAVWATPNGAGVVVAGRTTDPIADKVVTPTDAWVAEIDNAGNVLWEQTFGGPGYDGAWAIVPAPNDDWFVVGNAKEPHAGNASPHSWVWVRRLDPNGRLLEHRRFDADYSTWLAAGLLEGGGLVAAGGTWLVALDANLEILWERDLAPLGWTWLYDVAVMGSEVVAVGESRNGCGLVRLDEDGGVVSSRAGPEACVAAKTVSVLPDGELLIIGRQRTARTRTIGARAWRLAPRGDGWRVIWATWLGRSRWTWASGSTVSDEGRLAVVGGSGHTAGIALVELETGSTLAERRIDRHRKESLTRVVGTGPDLVTVGRQTGRGTENYDRWVLGFSGPSAVRWSAASPRRIEALATPVWMSILSGICAGMEAVAGTVSCSGLRSHIAEVMLSSRSFGGPDGSTGWSSPSD